MITPVNSASFQPAVTPTQLVGDGDVYLHDDITPTQLIGGGGVDSGDDDIRALVMQMLIQMTIGMVGNTPKLQQSDGQFEDDEEGDGF